MDFPVVDHLEEGVQFDQDHLTEVVPVKIPTEVIHIRLPRHHPTFARE